MITLTTINPKTSLKIQSNSRTQFLETLSTQVACKAVKTQRSHKGIQKRVQMLPLRQDISRTKLGYKIGLKGCSLAFSTVYHLGLMQQQIPRHRYLNKSFLKGKKRSCNSLIMIGVRDLQGLSRPCTLSRLVMLQRRSKLW